MRSAPWDRAAPAATRAAAQARLVKSGSSSTITKKMGAAKMTLITQAQIAAAAGNFRINAPGDYYFAEDLVYPFSYGTAIQNTAALPGVVRIFGQGRSLTSLAGPANAADG